jgi:hypothetical protein
MSNHSAEEEPNRHHVLDVLKLRFGVENVHDDEPSEGQVSINLPLGDGSFGFPVRFKWSQAIYISSHPELTDDQIRNGTFPADWPR